MTKPAAIQASYADYRRVKGRKVLQLIFEVPLEQAPSVHDIFGEPMPDGSTWVGIARIDQKKKNDPTPAPVKSDKPKRQWIELSRAEQAGIACNEQSFWRFLNETYGYQCEMPEQAAEAIREICGVDSRSLLDSEAAAGYAWDAVHDKYRVWLRAPEVVG